MPEAPVAAQSENLPDWLNEEQPTPAISALIAINLVVFTAMLITTLNNNANAEVAPNWITTLIAIPSHTLELWGANTTSKTIFDHQYWRLIASAFIHLNALHLAANMYVLWDFTRLVERLYGSTKYLVIYLVSAIGAAIVSLLFIDPANVSAGASGAVFGTFGAMVAFFWLHREHFPSKFALFYKKVFFVFFAYSIACAYVFKDMDNAAHAGGFLVGMWTALCIAPPAPGIKIWRKIDILRFACLLVVLVIGLGVDDKCVKEKPAAQAEAGYEYAVRLMEQKHYVIALNFLNKAIALHANDAAYYVDRAAAFSKLRLYQNSLTDCKQALRLEPHNKRALLGVSEAYHNLGDDQEAVKGYNYVLSIDAKRAVAYNNRGWSYTALGNYDKAIEDCTQALLLDPHLTSALDTRGLAYLLKGNYAASEQDLDRYIKLKPTEGAGYYHRALLYKKLGKSREATADLAKARIMDYRLETWEKKFFD